MVRSPRPAPVPSPGLARFGALAAGLTVATWVLLIATLPALWRVDQPPVLVSWFGVAPFVWGRLWGILPAPWGVRGAVGASFAVAVLVAIFAVRVWRVLLKPGDRPWLWQLAFAGAAGSVALGRAAVVSGLRGSEPLFLSALCFVTWGQAAQARAGQGTRPQREGILLGLLLAACAASPWFVLVLVSLPIARALSRLRERGVMGWFAGAFGAGMICACVAFLTLRPSASSSLHGASSGPGVLESAPGWRHALSFFRAVGESLGVVGCLITAVGLWSFVRERRWRAVACLAAGLVLLFIPGKAAEGTRVLMALWILALPLAAGILAIARTFGRAAVPAALVLTFVCLAWPVLDGMGRILLAHSRVTHVGVVSQERPAPRPSR